MSNKKYRLVCRACHHRFSAGRQDAHFCSVKCRMASMRKRRRLAHLNVHFSSGSEKWYTPSHLITLARTVLGTIDLDPASCQQANQTVQAIHFYSAAEDDLAQFWWGRVWLNPPYGKSIGAWVEKLCHVYETRQIMSALALLPARPGSIWWRRVSAYPMCFLHGRVRFNGAVGHAPFPSVVVYLGSEPNRFAQVFADSGTVVSPVMMASAFQDNQ